MKLITVTFLAIFYISQTECHPAWDMMGSLSANFGKGVDLFVGAGAKGNEANVGFSMDAFNGYFEKAKGMFDGLKDKSKEYYERVSEGFTNNYNSFKKQMSNLGENAKPIFSQMQRAMQGVSHKFEDFSELAKNKFGEWSDKTKTAFTQMGSAVHDFKKKFGDRMQHFSASTRAQAQKILERFEQEASGIMEKCRQRTLEHITHFYEHSQSVAEKSHNKFNSVVNEVKSCFAALDPKKCGEKLFGEAKGAFENLREDAIRTKNKFQELTYEDAAGHVCLSEAHEEIHKRRLQAQIKIDAL